MPELSPLVVALYLLPLAVIAAVYAMRLRRREAVAVQTLETARSEGMTEPPSLHPVVDPARCVGSGACVTACPERALGIIGGKATLVDPSACIGHGACAANCPVSAITLVFGTERRGVDIPRVKPDFETDVPGVFVAGELGGMGLIRKASEQGRQAVETIRKRPRASAPLDVVVVGAGPAGIAAGLAALDAKLRYRVIEQEADLGGAVLHYPRQKIAMTAPVDLPIVGKVRFTEIGKEKLLAFWQDIVRRTGLAIQFDTRMERVERAESGYRVVTSRGTLETATIVLAIGRRGTPRKLDVPGEELPKVAYRVVDPEQYRRQRVLVVGGGDSAIEAALACAEASGARVTLAYRGEAFNRVKAPNRAKINAAAEAGRIDVRLRTDVVRILENEVELRAGGEPLRLDNDVVIVQAGGILPTQLLKDIGVTVETKYGDA